jgi:hypothetical protein
MNEYEHPGSGSRIRIPDLDFFIHPGSRGKKGIGSRIRILNTGKKECCPKREKTSGLQGIPGTILANV